MVYIGYRYAMVRLRLCDGQEECECDAIVGVVVAPMRWAILGYAGALQSFDLQLLGVGRNAGLTPNASFPGRHGIPGSPPCIAIPGAAGLASRLANAFASDSKHDTL